MPIWLQCLLLVCLVLVLAVLLRLLVQDEPPDNGVTHEGREDDDRDTEMQAA